MFSGVMSLPIRQGKLWPGIEKSSKKFGRHLATIKYNLLLSPLYMSHIYKHRDAEELGESATYITGLKARLDSFMLDLHQRREEFKTTVQGPQPDENKKQNQTTGMRINEAQLDFIAADIRAVSATFRVATSEELEDETEDINASITQSSAPADVSRFILPDKDTSWIDMDDFVEMDWILPESNPDTKILPLAFAPRFTYFRQTDHQDNVSGDPTRHSPFGKEPTHYCVMTARNDPRRVQCDLIQDRLKKINDQIAHNKREIGQQELEKIREVEPQTQVQERLHILHQHNDTLYRKKAFLESTFESLSKRLRKEDRHATLDTDNDEKFYEAREEHDPTDADVQALDAAPFADYITDFNNRFIVHNVQLKWNNSLRNIILRYIHQVSQRRGFVYYMSRTAVKFILDILDEQVKSKERFKSSNDMNSSRDSFSRPESLEGDQMSINDRVEQLINDAKKFVHADEAENIENTDRPTAEDKNQDISVEYTAQNSYHVRLIAPQIQLQSEKNPKAAILVTAKGMQLKVIQIMDKDRVSDDVSGLVQRRFSAAMDSLQIFVTNSKTFGTEYLHMYSGNRYGTAAGSSWPPWVPFEVMFEFEVNPYGFQRVVQRTSASMRYDKYNTLRLKYNDDVSNPGSTNFRAQDNPESRVDHLWIDFPHLRAICDSAQYYALYIIVLDLLLYSEPLEKTRSERLEKIMLASDFSDLTGAPELVMMLQERIRQLEEIKMHFQINEKFLDRQGWKDRVSVEQDLTTCEDELFFMMKAITTSQRKADERQAAQSTGLLRWYIAASEIVWHLIREGDESLAEFQLKDALYDRTDNNDGSNYNTMEIGRIHGLNLLPNALYPDMIGPYLEKDRQGFDSKEVKMLRVQWHMLEAIAGIPVMDHFEVNLFPLRVQLEREIGKKMFEYVFPGVKENSSENGSFSPFMVKHMLPSQEEQDEDVGSPMPPIMTTPSVPAIEIDRNNDSSGSGAGSLEMRLMPTLTAPDRPQSSGSKKKTPKDHRGALHGLGIFQPNRSDTSFRKLLRNDSRRGESAETLTMVPRPSSYRSPSIMSSANSTSFDSERPKRFTLSRVGSGSKTIGSKDKDKQQSDDLTQMVNRASNYMTLAYVKIPSMVLCLSYKGKGQRNLEDVHNLVFRMPTLEYRNKTWSNLDLALQLKKDVMRALISHTGAIIGNKISKHKPSKQQQSRLRQIANSSTLISSGTFHDLSSSQHTSNSESTNTPANDSDVSLNEPRRSFASGHESTMSRTDSFSSSVHSGVNLALHRPSNASGMSSNGRENMFAIEPETEAAAFADELSRVDQTEPETIQHSLKRSLTGHFSNLKDRTGSALSAHKSGNEKDKEKDEDDGGSTRKKSKLLGSKLLGRLS
jgi:hypothetical protein